MSVFVDEREVKCYKWVMGACVARSLYVHRCICVCLCVFCSPPFSQHFTHISRTWGERYSTSNSDWRGPQFSACCLRIYGLSLYYPISSFLFVVVRFSHTLCQMVKFGSLHYLTVDVCVRVCASASLYWCVAHFVRHCGWDARWKWVCACVYVRYVIALYVQWVIASMNDINFHLDIDHVVRFVHSLLDVHFPRSLVVLRVPVVSIEATANESARSLQSVYGRSPLSAKLSGASRTE